MIRRVVIQGFKRFADTTFQVPGQVVLAGPNNTGKTTILQAIAAWGLALRRWKELNRFRPFNGAYVKAPMARQAFSAVPLRSFELLWTDRRYRGDIEIEVQGVDGWTIGMLFHKSSTEQIYVRPTPSTSPGTLQACTIETVFVPPMTGLSTEEPVYQTPKVNQLLGQGRPGEIIRNLLVEANRSEDAWDRLQRSIDRLFGYEILPPDPSGPNIIAEYRAGRDSPAFDIASAGSGFQQVLMLLTFLYTRPASVLLIDEPDAHLHVILQDAIFGELRSAAAQQRSQLIVATHSEVIINSVEPNELCVLLDQPRSLADTLEQKRLAGSMGILTQVDLMLALKAPGVLYCEDHTDLGILQEWARILDHPARELLTTHLFWKPIVSRARPEAKGIRAKEHYEALRLVRDDLPGLELLDGDGRGDVPETPITGRGLQRQRWNRYEIESYLFHPDALARYVEVVIGEGAASQLALEDLREYLVNTQPPAFIQDPLGDHTFLKGVKARRDLIPQALAAAGLPAVPYTSYHQIAAVMKPEEIHPEVREKLDAIVRAFGK
jgi:hypothetical protein